MKTLTSWIEYLEVRAASRAELTVLAVNRGTSEDAAFWAADAERFAWMRDRLRAARYGAVRPCDCVGARTPRPLPSLDGRRSY